MSNQQIITHCAPTLANVKIGNLFTVTYKSKAELTQHLKEKNLLFNEKGVFVRVLKYNEKTALIYVYRRSKLIETLKNVDIQNFLSEFSYTSFEEEYALSTLMEHLKGESFPHEVGIFLGYPIADIRGFIENQGKNCCCTGCWKVYHNPEKAKKIFSLYKKCSKIYLARYEDGFDMSRLTVVG